MTQGAKEFLERIAEVKLTTAERAVVLLWWHNRTDGSAAFTPQELGLEIEAAGYAKPHPSRLRDALKGDRRLAKVGGSRFKVRIEARGKIGQQFARYLQGDGTVPVEPPAHDMSRTSATPPTVSARSGTHSVNRPAVFIGSSAEGLRVAKALQENLDHDADSTIWSQGVFGLSSGTLETLAERAPDFDFAVLVLTPDDLTIRRGSEKQSPRDNVLFELGLFIGTLGRQRTFIICPRNEEMHLPTDLAGVTPSTYVSSRADGNMTAALGVVATQLQREFERCGRRGT